MAKITLPTIESGYITNTAFNEAFGAIQSELNNNVLYRNNPTGEPNEMNNDLDMNGFGVYNASFISADKITIDGVDYYEACRAEAERAKLEADRAKWEADRAHEEADRSEEAVNSYVETDPTVPWFVKEITTEDIERWDDSEAKADGVIHLNKQELKEDYTIPLGYNGLSAGPITFTGSVSVPPGAAYYVLDEDMGGGGGSVTIDAYTKPVSDAMFMERDIRIDRNESNINSNKNDIVELEEEIEALAPSFDRGHWKHDESPTALESPDTGKYYLLKDDDAITDNFSETHRVFFSNTDSEDPANSHTFSDVEVGMYLEMFETIDNSFLLATVVDVEQEAGYTIVEVNVAKAEGGPGEPTEGVDDAVRVKFFTVSGTVDLDTLMPKSGGTFTGEVKHKKDIFIEPTMPNRFVNIKNRYATNADGTDAGVGSTNFGINFDLDHGNTGYNKVKFTNRSGDILSVNGGQYPGANYYGVITGKNHLINKEYLDDFFHTLHSGGNTFKWNSSSPPQGENQFSTSSASTYSNKIYTFRNLYSYTGAKVNLKDYDAVRGSMIEIWKGNSLMVKTVIKNWLTSPASTMCVQFEVSGYKATVYNSSNFNTSDIYSVIITGLRKKVI